MAHQLREFFSHLCVFTFLNGSIAITKNTELSTARHISSPLLNAALTSESDLYEKWKIFLLQDLLHHCFDQSNLPTKITTQAESSSIDLSPLLNQTHALQEKGVSEEAFNRTKQRWINRLLALDDPSSDIADSLNALEELEFKDLLTVIQLLAEDPHTNIHVGYPENSPVMPLSVYETEAPSIGHIIKCNITPEISSSEEMTPFYELAISDQEKRMINELIRTMAEKSIWGLLFKKRELEKLGKRINHVHPMRFISFILADPKLKRHLKEVSTSSFKWDHFIDGFSKRMREESGRNNVTPYIPGMANALQFDQDRIATYIRAKDYEGLVKAVLKEGS